MALLDRVKESYQKPDMGGEEEPDDTMSDFDAFCDAMEEGDREGAYAALKSVVRACMDEGETAEDSEPGEKPKGGLALLLSMGKKK